MPNMSFGVTRSNAKKKFVLHRTDQTVPPKYVRRPHALQKPYYCSRRSHNAKIRPKCALTVRLVSLRPPNVDHARGGCRPSPTCLPPAVREARDSVRRDHRRMTSFLRARVTSTASQQGALFVATICGSGTGPAAAVKGSLISWRFAAAIIPRRVVAAAMTVRTATATNAERGGSANDRQGTHRAAMAWRARPPCQAPVRAGAARCRTTRIGRHRRAARATPTSGRDVKRLPRWSTMRT